MNLVLLGPPGAGKGTQARFITEKYLIPHISTGEIFRRHIRDNTLIGMKAQEYISRGHLVPDEVTIAVLKDRIMQDDCINGFLLDGFPRTIVQADALGEALSSMDTSLDHVISIEVPESILIDRLTGRRVCQSCGTNYHKILNPPLKKGICDKCGGIIIQRTDDSFETVSKRLSVYKQQTQPLVDYYNSKHTLRTINGEQDIDKVFENICNVLGSGNK